MFLPNLATPPQQPNQVDLYAPDGSLWLRDYTTREYPAYGAGNAIDARKIGVVADDVTDCTGIINTFFQSQASENTVLVLPPGSIRIAGTIDLVNRNNRGLRGRGMYGTILHKDVDDNKPLIEIAGYSNFIADLMLLGGSLKLIEEKGTTRKQQARYGIVLQGYAPPLTGDQIKLLPAKDRAAYEIAQQRYAKPSRFNVFRNLRIELFKVGIRVGHHTTLGPPVFGTLFPGDNLDEPPDQGDQRNPDIVGNIWENIFLFGNRHSLVRDGQNILNDHFVSFTSLNVDRYHVYLPFGGDFRCFTAQFGASLEEVPAKFEIAKIHSEGGGNVLLVNARSENGPAKPIDNEPAYPQPRFLRVDQMHTFAELHQVEVTNEYDSWRTLGTLPTPNDPSIKNLQIDLRGGIATLVNCRITGTVKVANTQYIGLNNEIGAYENADPASHNMITLDAQIALREQRYSYKGAGVDAFNSAAELRVSEVAVRRMGAKGEYGSRIHFDSYPTLDSSDGNFAFFPTSGDRVTQLLLCSSDPRPTVPGLPVRIWALREWYGTGVLSLEGSDQNSPPRAVEVHHNDQVLFRQDDMATHVLPVGMSLSTTLAVPCGGQWVHVVFSHCDWGGPNTGVAAGQAVVAPALRVGYTGRYRFNAMASFDRATSDCALKLERMTNGQVEVIAELTAPVGDTGKTTISTSLEWDLEEDDTVRCSVAAPGSHNARCTFARGQMSYVGRLPVKATRPLIPLPPGVGLPAPTI